jgi:hypothetical protein
MGPGGRERRRCRRALRRRGAAVQGRARRHRRRRHLALHAGRVHRPVPRTAPADERTDQGAQADGACGCVLARRQREHPADPDLWHGVLLACGSGSPSRAARAGARPRPPPHRAAARPVPLRRALPGVGVLASEGDDALQPARGRPPRRERSARLLGGEDASALRQGGLGDLGALGEVPRRHVPDPG